MYFTHEVLIYYIGFPILGRLDVSDIRNGVPVEEHREIRVDRISPCRHGSSSERGTRHADSRERSLGISRAS